MRAGCVSYGRTFPLSIMPSGQVSEVEEIKITLFLDVGEKADDALAYAKKWVLSKAQEYETAMLLQDTKEHKGETK